MTDPLVGGFHALSIPGEEFPLDGEDAQSVLAVWSSDSHQHFYRQNARSCLATLVEAIDIKRLWLPAYICNTLLPLADFARLEFYPMVEPFTADLDFLSEKVKADDAVLFVDYFGISCGSDIKELRRRAVDVLFIEDASMALNPGPASGDWRIFSPRKLMGVPNGGVAFCHVEKWSLKRDVARDPRPRPVNAMTSLIPVAARLENPLDNGIWYPLYQKSEAEQCVDVHAGISRVTLSVLSQIDCAHLTSKTITNQNLLAKLTEKLAHTPLDESGSRLLDKYPLSGLPVVVDNPDAVVKIMANEGVFCARHWKDIPERPSVCAASKTLSERQLTLPCDHRYNSDDMKRVADTFARALESGNG